MPYIDRREEEGDLFEEIFKKADDKFSITFVKSAETKIYFKE